MINKEQVQYIAKLARIKLTEKEIEKFQKELSSILDYFDSLKEVDVKGVEPTFYFKERMNITREDISEPEDPKVVERLIESAPTKKERNIKVKAIFS